jgi:hypothetical protein
MHDHQFHRFCEARELTGEVLALGGIVQKRAAELD